MIEFAIGLHSTLVQCGRITTRRTASSNFCLHSTLVQCGRLLPYLVNVLLYLVYIPPWFNADFMGIEYEFTYTIGLHSTLVQCGHVATVNIELQGIWVFTFHPGSMRTAGFCHTRTWQTLVYIPPWFNADVCVIGVPVSSMICLHSTLVQCGQNMQKTSTTA